MATYNEGIYEQAAYNTEADLGSTGLNHIGYPIGTRPILDIGNTEDVVAKDIYGQYYQSLEAGPQVADLVTAKFTPVNAKFLYYILGKRTASTGTRTISNLDGTARKQFLSVWKQTNELKQHCYGVLFEGCTIDMAMGEQPMVTMVGKGLKIASDSYSPAVTWANSIESRFDGLKGITWDGDSLTPYGCTINMQQNSIPIPGYDGKYQDINGQKPVFGTVNFVCTAAQGKVVFADFEASTAHDFTFTLGKATAAHSSHSIVGTFANARVMQSKMVENVGKEPFYNVLCAIETSSFVVTDGI